MQLLSRLLLALHMAAAAVLGFHGWQNPLPNWDIIPYTALVHSEAGVSPQALSQRTYADVRDYVGEAKFRPMVQGGDQDAAYRVALYGNPAALQDNLRFYSVKPLYVGLSRLAAQLTGNGASAGVLVSAAAFALLLAVFPLFFPQPLLAAAVLWPLVLLGAPALALVTQVATPDSLALVLIVGSAMLALAKRHVLLIAVSALLAVLARPDAAFLLAPFLLGMAWLQRGDGRSWPLVACFAAVMVLFVYLGKQALPWPTLFRHTFQGREPFPSAAALAQPVAVADYLAVLARTLPNVLTLRPLLFFMAGLALAIVPWLRSRSIAGWQWLALVAAGNMVVHYLIFPIDEYGHERMFLGSYFAIVAAGLLAWGERWGALRLPQPTREMLVFLVVGVLATATQYLVYAAGLAWSTLPAAAISGAGYLAGSGVSYVLNYHVTFRSARRHAVALPKFYAMVAAAFVLNTLLVALLVDRGGMHPWLGQLIATAVCLVWNYAVSRLWVFGARDSSA